MVTTSGTGQAIGGGYDRVFSYEGFLRVVQVVQRQEGVILELQEAQKRQQRVIDQLRREIRDKDD